MRIPVASAIALVVLLAGCGGTKTRTITAASPGPPTGTTATTATSTSTTSTATSPAPSGSGGTLASATAVVKKRGFTPDDPREYVRDHTLRVLIATRTGSADGYAKQAFFFVGGRFIGTDTSDETATMNVASQEDTTVALSYRLYRKNDPFCCPSGGERIVHYHWNGSRLVPEDPIPSSSDSAALSRR